MEDLNSDGVSPMKLTMSHAESCPGLTSGPLGISFGAFGALGAGAFLEVVDILKNGKVRSNKGFVEERGIEQTFYLTGNTLQCKVPKLLVRIERLRSIDNPKTPTKNL